MRIRFLAVILCLTAVPELGAQPAGEDVLDGIEEAYLQLRYEEAAELAAKALENYDDFTIGQLADVHTFLALIAYNRGELGEARRQFLSALQLMPDLELDPVLVPPRIQRYFDDIRSDAAAEDAEASDGAVRYVLVRDARPDAAFRSMLVPGWGQLYKGQRRKAYAFSGLFVGAAGGALLAHRRRARAEQRYEAAATVEEASERYEAYNAWHRSRNAFVQAAIVVWAVSYVDALLVRPSTSFSIQAAPHTVSMRIHF